MKMKRGLLLTPLFLFLFIPLTLAHPGRTASDGCHFCRTNCDRWGVPWNERHCHNGGSAPAPAVQEVQPIYIPPTKYVPPPTRIPTSTPYPTSTPIPSPTKRPTPTYKPKKVISSRPTEIPIIQTNQIVTPTTKPAENIWSWFRSLFN